MNKEQKDEYIGLWQKAPKHIKSTLPNPWVPGTTDEDLSEGYSLLEAGGYLEEGIPSKVTDAEGYQEYWDSINEDFGGEKSRYWDPNTDWWFDSEEDMAEWRDKHPARYAWRMDKPVQGYFKGRQDDNTISEKREIIKTAENEKEREEIRIATEKANEAKQASIAGWKWFADNNSLKESIDKLQNIHSQSEYEYGLLGTARDGTRVAGGLKTPPGWKKFDE